VFAGRWGDVKHLVEKYPGALFKGFGTAAEAEAWLASDWLALSNGGAETAPAADGQQWAGGAGAPRALAPQQQHATKRQRVGADSYDSAGEERGGQDGGEDGSSLVVTVVGGCLPVEAALCCERAGSAAHGGWRRAPLLQSVFR
jgi:hypothetical protein